MITITLVKDRGKIEWDMFDESNLRDEQEAVDGVHDEQVHELLRPVTA
jgi:hypothetical protein